MNLAKVSALTALCTLLLAAAAVAGGDLIVHSAGSLIVHTNVQLNSGSFSVESGGVVSMDLGSKITATNIVYGGTLTVSSNNLVLAAGQNYQLFSAPTYSGAFVLVNLPTLTSSLTWTNDLLNSGSVSVKSVASTLRVNTLTYSSNSMIFSGSGGSPNSSYWLLTTTNLALPVANWTVSATGSFDGTGSFNFSYPVMPGAPQQFFLLQVP